MKRRITISILVVSIEQIQVISRLTRTTYLCVYVSPILKQQSNTINKLLIDSNVKRGAHYIIPHVDVY